MVFAASRVMNAFGLLSLFSGSLTLFFNSLPLVQSQVRLKSISRKSLLFQLELVTLGGCLARSPAPDH